MDPTRRHADRLGREAFTTAGRRTPERTESEPRRWHDVARDVHGSPHNGAVNKKADRSMPEATLNPSDPNDFDSKRRQVANYGRFTVIHDPLVHRPYGLYRIYEGAAYIGALISFPGLSDCKWMAAKKKAMPAIGSTTQDWRTKYRRGATAPAALKWQKQKAAA
jgi:hypothetical protein